MVIRNSRIKFLSRVCVVVGNQERSWLMFEKGLVLSAAPNLMRLVALFHVLYDRKQTNERFSLREGD